MATINEDSVDCPSNEGVQSPQDLRVCSVFKPIACSDLAAGGGGRGTVEGEEKNGDGGELHAMIP